MRSLPTFIIDDMKESETGVCLSVVVPTYNESENIKKLLALLVAALDTKLFHDYEIIVVDDNSPDRTGKIVQELLSDYPQVRLIRRNNEKGLSSAVIRGWQSSHGVFLGVIDGDLQHPPDVLVKLIDKIRDNADLDLVIASRHKQRGGVDHWRLEQRIVSRTAQMLGLLLVPAVVGRVSDPMSGCFIIRRSALVQRVLKPLGYKILLEVLAKGNIRGVEEIGYIFQGRRSGRSKKGLNIYWEYILQLMQLRFNA